MSTVRKFLILAILILSISLLSFGTDLGSSFGAFLQNISPKKGTNTATYSLDSGLVGHWTFDGKDTAWNSNTTQDKSGQGNTGTMTSMSTTSSPTEGKLGQGLKFDGVNDRTIHGTSATLSFSGNYSFSVWTKWDVVPNGSIAEFILERGEAVTTNANYYLWVDNNSVCPPGAHLVYGFRTTGGVYSNHCYGFTAAQGTFHNLAVVYNGSRIKLYKDGVEVDDEAETATPQTAGTQTFYLGAQRDPCCFLNGTLDDVRIYNRALSADEVKQLYLQGSSLKQNVTPRKGTSPSAYSLDSGLVGHWTFDGKDTAWNSNTTQDKSGQGNTGTMTSMSTTTSPVPGKLGQGFKFDGVDDYVNVPDPGSGVLDFGDTADLTITAWIYPKAVPTWDTIAQKRLDASPGSAGYLFRVATYNVLEIDVSDGVDVFYMDAPFAPPYRWRHVTFVWDQDSAANTRIYIDGVNQSGTQVGTIGNIGSLVNGEPFVIGVGGGTGIDLMNGKIDDVRIYNRALSANEVKQLYLQGSSLKQSITPRKGTSPSVYSLESGLVGHWTFDGKDTAWNSNTTQDKSGQGNTGTITNMSTTTSPVPGKLGQGFNFDGVNDYVNVPHHSSIDFGANQDFTVSAWVKTRQGQESGQYPMIVHKIGGAPLFGYSIHLHSSTDDAKWYFEIYQNGANPATTGSSDIADGTWHHVVGQRIGSTLNTYQDGVFANTAAGNSGTVASAVAFNIGRSTSNNFFVNGTIDDVRIYNRALSASEVKQLYLMGR